MSALRDHFLQLARYNAWATRRLLVDHIAALPDELYRRDAGLFFKSIHGTLNHLLVGEQLVWFSRFAEGVSPRIALDTEAEPDRERLAQRLIDGSARWLPLIEAMDEALFTSTLRYTSTRGVPTALPFGATLAHVFNHGTHHRGQISAALTAMGQPCPELDLVLMLVAESPST
ncbi:DinB family protein [Ideonella sp. BN130291]|uniref:DinB family protein n=1 Tax=Ideonella sp. BN130291 TaxID=3112940 RepID=UPI002E259DDF|nr:DinB family protein [Ideonella sp. BN130291]